MYLIDPSIYATIYYSIILLFTLFYILKINMMNGDDILYDNSKSRYHLLSFILSIVLILFLGLRPVHSVFVDTINYAQSYNMIQFAGDFYFETGNIGFKYLMLLLSKLGFSVNMFLLSIEAIYIGSYLYVCQKIFRSNSIIALLAIFGTFFFLDFGVNILRNGMALSLMFIALYFLEYRQKKFLGLIFAVASINIHISCLIILIIYIATKFINNSKIYILIWIVCLILSLSIGREFENIFTKIGILEDWRSSNYLIGANRDMSIYAVNGFRWDFLLFSIPPIIWGYYVIFKNNFTDVFYLKLYQIYVSCNAFWLLVNQNWLSNRFAMLSWFLYSVIFVYPLLMKKDFYQKKLILSLYMLGNVAFAFIYNVL